MQLRKKENGYALVIVLLVVVFIMTVSAVFMRGSISNAKQERIVDNNNLSTVAAEMGVDYYKTVIINEFNKEKKQIVQAAQAELEQLYKDTNQLTPQQEALIYNKLRTDLSSALNSAIGKSLPLQKIDGELMSFQRSNFVATPNLDNEFEVLVTGKVKGIRENAKESVLNVSISFEIPDIVSVTKDDSPNEGNQNDGDGTKPVPPPPQPSGITTNKWPCNDDNKNNCNESIKNYMSVGNVSMKKGSLLFQDHLVVNSLRIDGGNGASVTVAKDLYVKDTLDAQTHACIAVQGNFTAINSILSKNKLYIFVYGDAYLPTNINLTSSNNEIHVSGDVYIGGIKQIPKKFSSVPKGSSSNSCTLPGPGTNEKPGKEENNPGTNTEWEIEGNWADPNVSVKY